MRSAPGPTSAQRLARRAWRLLYSDAAAALVTAERALAQAQRQQDDVAEAWARLARGFHWLYFGTLDQASDELAAADALFQARGDRAGHILAQAGRARSLWRGGNYQAAIDTVLPLRDEGLRVLRHDQRGALLNTIAGCYSVIGDSERAFAYMYQALRDAGPARGHGIDAVLHCNLSNELLQLGDFEEALRHIDLGVERSAGMKNAFLRSVLLINRVICLTEMGRAAEAQDDIAQILALPPDPSGRGGNAKHFETLAISALAAGDAALGASLIDQALASPGAGLPDERLELAIARALLAQGRHGLPDALAHLAAARALAGDDAVVGLSLRVRCQFFHCASVLHDQAGDAAQALADLRHWQVLHLRQAQRASRARYQAAMLQTELLRLQHRLEDLSRQATRDALTGLFNRRHLDDTLPALLVMARRERQPLALAIVDLDHFKSVNDRFGHDVGDRLLAGFGRLLAESVRDSDVACRYGGEEFCLLMPGTTAKDAQRKLQALLQRWRRQRFDVDELTLQGLSFSAGVVDSAQQALATPALLLKAADQALLTAKQRGRNRVLGALLPDAAEDSR